MKRIILGSILTLFTISLTYGQSIVGKWKTIDDESGKAKSIVEIYKKGNQYYGKIVELLIKPESDTCVKCKDDRKGKSLIGLEIIRNMKPDDDEYEGGTIVDPKSGKVYKCLIKPNGSDKLDVRGYIGFSLIGRTQTWHKVQ